MAAKRTAEDIVNDSLPNKSKPRYLKAWKEFYVGIDTLSLYIRLCGTSSIHPASLNKTTYSTVVKSFISLENSRNFIFLAPCGRSKNKMSRVFS